jgi:hypothetical protein
MKRRIYLGFNVVLSPDDLVEFRANRMPRNCVYARNLNKKLKLISKPSYRQLQSRIYLWQVPCSNEITNPPTMSDEWVTGIEGNFPLHKAVLEGKIPKAKFKIVIRASFLAMPSGVKPLSAETHGTSSWSKTAKVVVLQPDGTRKAYFLKVALHVLKSA